MAILVRPASAADAGRLAKFDCFSGDRIAEIIEKRMIVAEVDGTVAGYIAWQARGLAGADYVNRLVTDPPFRQRGVANRLVEQLPFYLQGRVFISAGEHNEGASRLLARTGWIKAGSIRGMRPDDERELFFFKDLVAPGRSENDTGSHG